MRSDARFCSEECNSAAHAMTRKMAKRAGRKKHADDPLFERNYIAKRDKYRCGLCGGKVDMTRQHPDPMFASIDHVVPLSQGGTNDLHNLQLAHLRCNLTKRATGGSEQLRLLG
jgi:5-methylcytosine-specific restriction endonuclease McrA